MIALLLACDEPGPWVSVQDATLPETRVSASPALLDFGDVSVNEIGEVELNFAVDNLGEGPVTITGQNEPIGDHGFTIAAEPIEVIEMGGHRVFSVRFAPETEAGSLAYLRIDPGSEIVELRGSGRAPVAALSSPQTSPTVVGCTGHGSAILTNTGSESLSVDSASVDGPDFALTAWTNEVAAGQSATLEFDFTPLGSGDRGATLALETNDPLHPALALNFFALGYEGERVAEQFRYAPSAPTDIVVAIEGGMGENAARLGPALEAYVDNLRSENADFQITALASNSGCPPDSPPFADLGDTALATTNVLARAFDEPGGAWDTDLVGLAATAIANSGPGGCLEGFRRDAANLDLLVIGRSEPATDQAVEAAQLADTLQDPSMLRVSALAPLGGECGDAGLTYGALAAAFRGVAAEYCEAVWVDAFNAFATLPTADSAVTFALREVPVVSTLSVSVEGGLWTEWSYDAEANAVVFASDLRPPLGAEVAVTYVSAVACED